MEKEHLNNILIVKLSAIGDVVHTLPFLEVLRKNFPKARIDWLVEQEASQIVKGHRDVDNVIISFRKSWQTRLILWSEWPTAIREVWRFFKLLRSNEYDLVIDLQGLLRSGLLTGISKGKRKIGPVGGREGSSMFLTEKPYTVDHDVHALDRYLKTADYLGCANKVWEGKIPIRQSDEDGVDQFLRANGVEKERLVAINPMAGWSTKLWENENFALVADKVQAELACQVVFTGGEKDRVPVRRIIEEMKQKPLNLVGRTGLKELAHLYSKCELLITTDTGPMHIAAAMGCPVVALFGPTAPWRTGPYGKGHVVIREEMACSPCFKKRCASPDCMRKITVDRVFEAVKRMLGAHAMISTMEEDTPPSERPSRGVA